MIWKTLGRVDLNNSGLNISIEGSIRLPTPGLKGVFCFYVYVTINLNVILLHFTDNLYCWGPGLQDSRVAA